MSPSTHQNLIDASQEIGQIAESAAWYTRDLTRLISQTYGHSIDNITVDELRRAHAFLRDRATREYAEALL